MDRNARCLAAAMLAVGSILASAHAQVKQDHHPEAVDTGRTSGIGYPTVAAALAALKGRTDVDVSEQGGWTIVTDSAGATLWSFTPRGHPAHPAVVKRVVTQRGDTLYIDMAVRCEAERPACDRLVAEFEQLNARLKQSLGRNSQ